jgi:uncharacterized transporter YbjL
MKIRYCEICGGCVGTMSDEAWEIMDYICDLCAEKEPKPSYNQEE